MRNGCVNIAHTPSDTGAFVSVTWLNCGSAAGSQMRHQVAEFHLKSLNPQLNLVPNLLFTFFFNIRLRFCFFPHVREKKYIMSTKQLNSVWRFEKDNGKICPIHGTNQCVGKHGFFTTITRQTVYILVTGGVISSPVILLFGLRD